MNFQKQAFDLDDCRHLKNLALKFQTLHSMEDDDDFILSVENSNRNHYTIQ